MDTIDMTAPLYSGIELPKSDELHRRILEYELQEKHNRLRKEVLDYIVAHPDNDPIDLLGEFAEKIRVLIDCDQVIYRDLEETRIMVNSPAIEKTWSVPIDYCRQCLHFNAHHPMYAGGYTEMDNCQEGWQGIPVFHKCPIKSSLTRIVYCNGETAGYLAIHFVQKYHHFTDIERKTLEEFVNSFSVMLSRYESNKKLQDLQRKDQLLKEAEARSFAENNSRILALEDKFESLYDVNLESGEYEVFIKGETFGDVNARLVYQKDFFADTYKNAQVVLYPDDKEGVLGVMNVDYIRKALETRTYFDWYYRLVSYGKPVWVRMRILYKDAARTHIIVGVFNAEEEMAKKRKAEEEEASREAIIQGFANKYEASYVGNLLNGSYRMITSKGAYLDKLKTAPLYTVTTQHFTDTYVHPDDRHHFNELVNDIEAARTKLKIGETVRFEYRSDTGDGYVWHRANILRISESDVLMGDEVCDDEVLARIVNNKLMDEYDALYLVNLEKDQIQSVRSSRVSNTGMFTGKRQYSQMVRTFADTVAPGYHQDWVNFSDPEFIREYLALEDHREYIYELPSTKTIMRRLTFDVIDRVEGKAQTVLMSFMGIDDLRAQAILLHKQLAEQASFTQYFLEPYQSAYYVGLDDLSLQVYKRTTELEEQYPITTNYVDSLLEYIQKEVHPDDREKMAEMIDPARMKETLSKQPEISYIFRRITDGKLDYIRFQVIRGADKAHAAFGFRDVTREIEQQQAQQKQLQDALAMAQSANKAKTTFLNNMSHDIRTPMNAIIGFTGLAASHIDNKSLVKDYLTKISQSSDHLLSLINDVLDMSRIESGKMHIEEKEENLSDIIHTLRDIIQANFQSKRLEFFVDAADIKDENVICDKLRLNQVLLNILSNAIKYTPAGGTISLRVKETAVRNNGYASYQFVIKDNGIGMSKEFLKTIYDPFTRVKSSTVSGIQGTGLGMAITKNIIDMMGGKIDIQSNPGQGTEVKVEFDFMLQNNTLVLDEISELKGLRALIVDDDTNTCISVAKMLKDIGMRSLWCTSGREAVIRAEDAFRNNDIFKLYIIDGMMPDMNGIETTRRIRKAIGEDVPVIILTAYDWADIEQEAREAGVTEFVSKPMFPSDLHKVLSKCVGRTENDAESKDGFSLEGKKILLVEDNELNREIATAILEEFNCTIDTASDGDIAVEKMKNAAAGDYDIVLMDIQMPTIDGYEATRRIRALGTEISKIPIIAMTANAFEEDRRLALAAGMDEHIAKPIDIDKLKETISKFL